MALFHFPVGEKGFKERCLSDMPMRRGSIFSFLEGLGKTLEIAFVAFVQADSSGFGVLH